MPILTFNQFKTLYASENLTCYYPGAEPDGLSIWIKHFGPHMRLLFFKVGACYVPFVEKKIFGKRMIFLFCGRELWSLPIYKEADCEAEKIKQDLKVLFTNFFSGAIFIKVSAAPEWFTHTLHSLSLEFQYRSINRPSKSARIISCDTSFTEYLGSIANTKHIREVGRLKRNIEKKYGFDFHVFTGEEAAAGLEKAYAISRKSWKEKQGTSIGGNGKDGLYYREIFDYFLKRHCVYVFILTVGKEPAGFLVGCRRGDVLFCVKTGFDESFKADGLGSIVFYEAIRWCFDESSISKIDFLTDYRYLRFWARETAKYHSLYLFNTSFLSRGAHCLAISLLFCKRHLKNIFSALMSRSNN